jgi:folate-binding protein YgfZ
VKFAPLNDRSLINVSGEEAESFLDNILTCKVIGLEEDQASFGALLTPQGKILFDFFLIKKDDGFVFDIATSLAEDFTKRLTFYRLRAKVTIEPQPELSVFALWGGENPNAEKQVADPRLKNMGWRDYSGTKPNCEGADYTEHRINNAMPQGGLDFDYGDAYPHEVLMDQFGGVDFKKGCYVGQEVVSRMQHRGTAKKRIIIVESKDPLPATSTPITADGKPAGTLGSVSGNIGLAMLRLDRIAKAETILADKTAVTPRLPNWVNFKMPETE